MQGASARTNWLDIDSAQPFPSARHGRASAGAPPFTDKTPISCAPDRDGQGVREPGQHPRIDGALRHASGFVAAGIVELVSQLSAVADPAFVFSVLVSYGFAQVTIALRPDQGLHRRGKRIRRRWRYSAGADLHRWLVTFLEEMMLCARSMPVPLDPGCARPPGSSPTLAASGARPASRQTLPTMRFDPRTRTRLPRPRIPRPRSCRLPRPAQRGRRPSIWKGCNMEAMISQATLDHLPRLVPEIMHVDQQDGELVAAGPRHRVRFAGAAQQALRRFLQQLGRRPNGPGCG
jgi:hypothetical protein